MQDLVAHHQNPKENKKDSILFKFNEKWVKIYENKKKSLTPI